MNYVILLALAAMVLFGLVDFFVKKAMIVGVNVYALFFYCMSMVVVSFGILWVIQSPLKIDTPLLGYSLTVGVLLFIATLTLIAALKKGEASIVVPIGRMGFVITAVCAFIFLGEQLTMTRGLGILSAVIAILLLSRK